MGLEDLQGAFPFFASVGTDQIKVAPVGSDFGEEVRGAVELFAIEELVLDQAAALSLRLWRHWRGVMPQRWIEVRYERLVHDARGELARLVETLDLPWDDKMLTRPNASKPRGVRTPTYADVAQPLYTRAIGRWRNYAQWLEPHLGPLAPFLSECGYDS